MHPSGALRDPILHPELNVGVEWRFFHFQFEHALKIVRATVQILHELAMHGKPANIAVENYAVTLRPHFEVFNANEILNAPAPQP